MPWNENETYTTVDGYETHWFPETNMDAEHPWVDKNGVLITDKPLKTIAQRLADLYITYRKKWNCSDNGQVFMVKQGAKPLPLKQVNLYSHLSRQYAVHIFAGPQTSKFICFDVDDAKWGTVLKLISTIEILGIPRDYVYVSTSGNKGYHVEVFFDRVVYLDYSYGFYVRCMAKMGALASHIEFRPTNDHSIKLPLSIHPKTGNVCWYLDRNTGIPICSVDYLLDIKQFSQEKFMELASQYETIPFQTNDAFKWDAADQRGVVDKTRGNDVQFDALPDWVPMLTEPRTRHNTMVHIACEANHRHFNYDATFHLLELWIEKQNLNYYTSSEKEIYRDIELICDWVYRGVDDSWCAPTNEHLKWLPSLGIDLNDENAMAEQRHNPRYCFDAASAARVLSLSSQNRRKLYFLILCEHVATNTMGKGYYKASMERIGEIVGMAQETVASRIKKMLGEGYIWSPKVRRYRNKDGKPRVNSRAYKVSDFPIKCADWDQYTTGNTYTGRISDLESNFVTEYYRAMFTVLQRDYVISHLTKWEKKDLMQHEAPHDDVGGGN